MLDNITNLSLLIGGLGMFLYGMHVMVEGTQRSVGNKMKDFLGTLTPNRLKAVLVGTLTTGIIQSSGVTTVMVVGLVSAGLIALSQAVGIIMGANIGTTMIARIVSLSQTGDSMKSLNPEFYAPVLTDIDACIIMFSKSDTKKNRTEIIIGFGLLLQGFKFISESVVPYTDAPIFATVFTTLGSNLFPGILADTVVTVLLQSSSVSVGTLQMLTGSGLIATNAVIFATLGESIGPCVTAMFSSIGGSRDVRRVVVIHLSFNMIGALLLTVISILFSVLKPALTRYHIGPVQILMFHTGLKLTITVLLFPFGEQSIKPSGMLVPKKQTLLTGEKKEEELVTCLDPRIFEQPAIAVAALSNAVASMSKLTLRNVEQACEVCFTQGEVATAEIFETEKKINAMNRELSEHLIKANTPPVSDHQRLVVADLFNTLMDLERSGDHAEDVAKEVQFLMTCQLTLSETGKKDPRDMMGAVQEAFRCAIKAREERSVTSVRKVGAYEDPVDSLYDEQKECHMDRPSRGEYKPEVGLAFIEIIDNLERISDHAQDMTEYIMNEIQIQQEPGLLRLLKISKTDVRITTEFWQNCRSF